MKLTPEQQSIVDYNLEKGEALKCLAYAGTGKTSTLVAVAQKYGLTNQDCLYLAFNKSVESEALMKFPCHTTCKTGHALAWQYVGRRYSNIANLYNWQLAKAYSMPLYEASLLLKSFESFLNSADMTPLVDHVEPDTLNRYIPGRYEEGMVAHMEQLWIDMQDERNGIPMSHSGYLKMFQLGIETGDYALPHSVIMLDEAQDTNPVMLKIVLDLMRNGARCYFVGDPYQQIYSWRGALDAMEKIDAPERRITQSFRFGDDIAAKASFLLRQFYNEHIPVRGYDNNHKGITKATICRTNAGILSQAAAESTRYHVAGERAYRDFLDSLTNVYHLYVARPDLVTEKRLLFHRNWSKLKEYAEESLDIELQGKIRIVEEYTSQWPDMHEKLIQNLAPATCNNTYTTCHKAKGLEWDNVRIHSDFRPISFIHTDKDGHTERHFKTPTRNVEDDETEIHPEEINLLYVAITRSRGTLTLPANLRSDFIDTDVDEGEAQLLTSGK